MDEEEAKRMLESDPEWIASKRFGHSLTKLMERYPEGCPDRIIAAALMIDESEIEERYKTIVLKLRGHMGVDSL
jgi:hypothetical protein